MERFNMDERLFFNFYRDNRGASDLMPTFDNQSKLSAVLVERGDDFLISHGVNVLTVRFLLGQDAFRKLCDYELELKQKPGGYIVNMGVAGFGASVYTLNPTPGFIGDVIQRQAIRAHEYFYAFLTSMASILDRLAHEINHFYQLGLDVNQVDWRNLDKGFGALEKRNASLKEYLQENSKDSSDKTKLLLEYRDVAEHRGAVKIEEFPEREIKIDEGYAIKVQATPRETNSPADTELLKTCRALFEHVIKICDDVYGFLISDISVEVDAKTKNKKAA